MHRKEIGDIMESRQAMGSWTPTAPPGDTQLMMVAEALLPSFQAALESGQLPFNQLCGQGQCRIRGKRPSHGYGDLQAHRKGGMGIKEMINFSTPNSVIFVCDYFSNF